MADYVIHRILGFSKGTDLLVHDSTVQEEYVRFVRRAVGTSDNWQDEPGEHPIDEVGALLIQSIIGLRLDRGKFEWFLGITKD